MHLRGLNGKSELIRDLARSVGRYTLFISVNEGLGLRVLQNLLFGALTTGTWLCFRNMEELPIQHTQLVARFILSVFEALNSEKLDINILG